MTTFQVPFARPNVGAEEAWAARRAIAAGQLTHGPDLEAAQSALAARWGIRPGRIVLTSSGTAALWLAYKALGDYFPGVPGVPALTFPATANVLENFEVHDCDLETPPTDVAVGLWGRRPKCAALGAFVFDYCQCIGSLEPEKDAITCYSFNSSKPITAAGGGVAVFATADDASHATARFSPRMVGGGSWAMTNVQAAILAVQLKRWAELMAARVATLDAYAKNLPIQHKFNVPVISVPGQAAALGARLADYGVEAKRPWVLGGDVDYPLANSVRDSLVALPMGISKEVVTDVVKLVKKACQLEGIRL